MKELSRFNNLMANGSRFNRKANMKSRMCKGSMRKIVVSFMLLICVSTVNWGQKASDYRASAERGDKIAQYNMGLCYKQGLGVTKDDTQAVSWFRKSADQGFAKSQCHR